MTLWSDKKTLLDGHPPFLVTLAEDLQTLLLLVDI